MQTSVNNYMSEALEGALADLANKDVRNYINYSKMLVLLTITAVNNFSYTVTINGVTFTYLSDSTATQGEIVAGLLAVINAGSEPVTAISGTTVLYLRSDVAGTAFTLTTSANIVATTQIANAQTISFGKFVCQDSETGLDSTARLPYQAADITGLAALGIAIHSHDNEQALAGSTNPGYAHGVEMNVVRQGTVWVRVEDAVVAGGAVFVRYTVNGTKTPGSFRSDADSSKAAQLPNARYETSANAGGLAVVKFLLPKA